MITECGWNGFRKFANVDTCAEQVTATDGTPSGVKELFALLLEDIK